ncbi:MAG: hypothetical protein GY699_15680 [Desulfobacteraceae bacterium]|nr:hypothetical protein [Desulfobacteraceae bacterium]
MKPFMVLTCFFIVFLTGCSSLEYPVAHHKEVQPGVSSLSYTSDLRATHILKRKDGNYWILSEPAPDAAFSYEDEQDLDLSLIKFGGSNEGGKEESVSGASDLPLTGRSSYLLLAREILFRINEMAYNTNATPEQYQAAFANALKIIQAIAALEAPNVTSSWTVNASTGETSDLKIDDSVLDSNTEKVNSTSTEPVKLSGNDDGNDNYDNSTD